MVELSPVTVHVARKRFNILFPMVVSVTTAAARVVGKQGRAIGVLQVPGVLFEAGCARRAVTHSLAAVLLDFVAALGKVGAANVRDHVCGAPTFLEAWPVRTVEGTLGAMRSGHVPVARMISVRIVWRLRTP